MLIFSLNFFRIFVLVKCFKSDDFRFHFNVFLCSSFANIFHICSNLCAIYSHLINTRLTFVWLFVCLGLTGSVYGSGLGFEVRDFWWLWAKDQMLFSIPLYSFRICRRKNQNDKEQIKTCSLNMNLKIKKPRLVIFVCLLCKFFGKGVLALEMWKALWNMTKIGVV